MTGSIRQRLMLLVLASVAVVWIAALFSSYRQAVHEVDEWEDARIELAARALILANPNDLQALAKRGGRTTDDDGDDDASRELLYEVRDASGRLLAASPGLPAMGAMVPSSPPGDSVRRERPHDSNQWHSYALRDNALGRSVRVFERSDSRADLGTSVARRIAKPIVYALPVLAVLIWLGIGGSLAPLKTLSRAVSARNADNLDPIDMRRTPAEVRPLVDALNVLLSRLRGSLDHERAFTADAAHELKSPLAAIKVQAQVALATRDPVQQRVAMQRVVEAVDRSTHLADQLLLLARLDEGVPVPASMVDLEAVAGDCIAAHQRDAMSRGIDLVLCDDGHATVHAAPALVRILLDNLVDNAIKYGEPGGRVEVLTRRTPPSALLTVRDNGPGVAEADRSRLSDRFYRVAGNRQAGSGLGLSIVARIAVSLDAKLTFTEGIDGRGLGVELLFPASQHTTSDSGRLGA